MPGLKCIAEAGGGKERKIREEGGKASGIYIVIAGGEKDGKVEEKAKLGA